MKKTLIVFLFPLFLSAFDSQELVLGIGEQKCLPTATSRGVSIGNSNVIRVKFVDSKCLLVKGIGMGYSDLVFFQKSLEVHYNIHVISKKISHLVSSLSELFKNNEHLLFRPLPDGVLIQGEIYSYKEAQILGQIRRLLKDKLILQAVPTSELVTIAEDQLKKNFPNFKIIAKQTDILVLANYNDEEQKAFLEDAVYGVYPLAKISWAKGEALGQQAKVRVRLLEVKESSEDSKGLDWNKIVGNILSVNPTGLSYGGQMNAALTMLSKEGIVKILSQSELVIKVKEHAKLFAGGELPVVTFSKTNSSVEWKKYGLDIDLGLLAISDALLKFDIKINQSELDRANAYKGIPALFQNSLASIIQTRDRIPLVLTGLEKIAKGEDEEGIWGLSKIPILGNLFKTKNKSSKKNQLCFTLEAEIDHGYPSAI